MKIVSRGSNLKTERGECFKFQGDDRKKIGLNEKSRSDFVFSRFGNRSEFPIPKLGITRFVKSSTDLTSRCGLAVMTRPD